MSIRLPRVLDAQGREKARIQPLKLSLQLRLRPLSTAEMILSAPVQDLSPRDLVELYDEHGSVGVFRVSAMDATPGETCTVYLEHGLATLSDSIVPALSLAGSPRETLSRLLECQSEPLWQLGDLELPDDLTMICAGGYENLLTAFLRLTDMLPAGLNMALDQSSLPWTIHLRSASAVPECEGRLSRNLTSVRISCDAGDLCTRVYPFGTGQGMERVNLIPLTGSDHLQSAAADKWGVISRTFTSDSIYDVPTLRDVALRYLEQHAEPTMSIVLSGVDLSEATQESADAFLLGRCCRLCLPEEDSVFSGRIVAIDKPDVLGAPGQLTATLSNRFHDASDEIAGMLREVSVNKILGGRVSDVTSSTRAEGTADAPAVHYFTIEDWPAVLDAKATVTMDPGVYVVSMRIDSFTIPREVYATGTFSILPYLRRNELGVVAQGQHFISVLSNGGFMTSRVTIRIIENI